MSIADQLRNNTKHNITTTMKKTLIEMIEARSARSAWDKGVRDYAIELLDGLEGEEITESELLNGARDWREYSYGGSSLIYDTDIAERLCSPSELRKTRNGERNPNSSETWLDCQARALFQAALMIEREARKLSMVVA